MVNGYVDGKGERVTVAALEAEQGFDSLGRNVVLTASCRAGRFWLAVHWGDALGGDLAQVAYHFAPQPFAEHVYWAVGVDGESVEVAEAGEFVRRLVRSTRLTVRVTLPSGEQNVGVFVLRGAAPALRRVLEACR